MSWVTKTTVTPYSLAHLEDQVLEIGAGLRVDRRERLVHQQDLRLVGQRAGDRHALLHPAGELPRVAVQEAREAHRLDGVLDELGGLGLLSCLRRSGNATFWRTLIQGNSERLYSWKTSAMFSGGPSIRLVVQAAPRREVGGQQPGHALEQRRLAAARRARRRRRTRSRRPRSRGRRSPRRRRRPRRRSCFRCSTRSILELLLSSARSPERRGASAARGARSSRTRRSARTRGFRAARCPTTSRGWRTCAGTAG